jgi:hypothetical protein
MLGAETPGMGDEMGGEVAPDAMNPDMGAEVDMGDEFGASDASAGGLETAGREQRESIDRSSNLLRVLAG